VPVTTNLAWSSAWACNSPVLEKFRKGAGAKIAPRVPAGPEISDHPGLRGRGGEPMKRSVDRRRCSRAAQMQAAIDGTPAPDRHRRDLRLATPTTTKPVQPRRDDDPPLWFTIWNVRRSVAYAIDAYEDERIPYERALRSARRQVGDQFAGPFSSRDHAHDVAVRRLIGGIKRRRSA